VKSVAIGLVLVVLAILGIPAWPFGFLTGAWRALVLLGMIGLGVFAFYTAMRPPEYVAKLCPNCQAPTEQYLKKTSYSEKKKYWVCEKCRKKYSEPFELPTKKESQD
jgi:hypothetical protein